MRQNFIVSIIATMLSTGAAFAAPQEIPSADRTALATKEYVDNMVQAKIAPGTPGSVVVYDGYDEDTGQTQFSEVAIFDGSNDYNESTDYDTFITAGVIADVAATAETLEIPDTELVCANSPECSLWTRPAASATIPVFAAGTFAPLTQAPACLTDGSDCTGNINGCCNYCDNSSGQLHPVCSGCKTIGASCSGSGECCGIATCVSGVCSTKVSKCGSVGMSCSSNGNCCTNNCVNSVCVCSTTGASCTSGNLCCSGLCVNSECL